MRSDTSLAMVEETPAATRLLIPAEPIAVREGLQALFATSLLRALPDDERSTAEIVLAEVLNNIVEHAYAKFGGDIEITMNRAASELVCRVVDTGLPLPDGVLPPGVLKPLDPEAELPEGGFGWFLIRTLSRDLEYLRDGTYNRLSFRLDAGQTAH